MSENNTKCEFERTVVLECLQQRIKALVWSGNCDLEEQQNLKEEIKTFVSPEIEFKEARVSAYELDICIEYVIWILNVRGGNT